MSLKEIIIKKIFKPYSIRFEKYRNAIVKKNIDLSLTKKVLDFGGSRGTRMKSLFPDRTEGIFIADISKEDLEIAKNEYGFETILLDESGKIPFEDKYFDFVFCNSVIEHVTVDKDEIYNITSNEIFKQKSLARQKILAEEIKRVGKTYFVQTPNKHFIIESHTWFPSVYMYFSRKMQIKVINFLNRYWIKSSGPDFLLLTFKDLKKLFSEAEIIREKSFFMTKSLIALKKQP